MTFEEKLAAQGRKLDAMKAKLDDSVNAAKAEQKKNREELAAQIAEWDAALDELDAAIDTKINTQLDALDAKAEKQIQDVNAAIDLAGEQLSLDAQKVKSAFTLDRATAESIASAPSGIDLIQKGTEEQVAGVKGSIASAAENARLLRDRREGKMDSVKIRAQMQVNSAKEKVAAHKEALDKAAREEWILDLLDYANSCYEMAYAWALEAENTMLEVNCEIDEYNALYCDKE